MLTSSSLPYLFLYLSWNLSVMFKFWSSYTWVSWYLCLSSLVVGIETAEILVNWLLQVPQEPNQILFFGQVYLLAIAGALLSVTQNTSGLPTAVWLSLYLNALGSSLICLMMVAIAACDE